MNRAVRKRASKLRQKALKQLPALAGGDLRTVSNRLSQQAYADALGRFEKPVHKSASDLARDLAGLVVEGTEFISTVEIPRMAPESSLKAIDCRAGCAWCCRQPVQVSILGAISVAAHLLDTGRDVEASDRLGRFVRLIEPLRNDRARLKECFEPCPFLGEDEKCRVYEARPVVCRAFHSTDVGKCRDIVDGANPVRDVPMYPKLFGFTGMALSGVRKALSDLGLDDRPVVLASAVKLLLEDFEQVVSGWLEGEPVFDSVAVTA